MTLDRQIPKIKALSPFETAKRNWLEKIKNAESIATLLQITMDIKTVPFFKDDYEELKFFKKKIEEKIKNLQIKDLQSEIEKKVNFIIHIPRNGTNGSQKKNGKIIPHHDTTREQRTISLPPKQNFHEDQAI